MKYVFWGWLGVMLVLSGVAAIWRPAPTDNRIKLVWATDDAPNRREVVALFNATNTKYRVELDSQQAGGGFEKVIIQCLAGVGPDMFDCYDPFQLAAFVRAGVARDCTDDLAAMGVDMSEVWPCVEPTFRLDGRVYGHPGNVSAPAIWYNKRLFDEAGVPYPRPDWTWDEFMDIARKLTRRDEYGRPVQFGYLGPADPLQFKLFVHMWNGHFYNEARTRSILDSPEAGAGIQFLQDLVYKHRIMPTPSDEGAMASAGGWGTATISLLAGEKGAMATGGRWWLLILRKPEYRHLRLGVVELPRGPSGRILGDGKSTLINKHSSQIAGALEFLAFLHGQAYNDLINRQADGLAPVMKYCSTDAFLHNPEYPQEDYNDAWRAAAAHADPNAVSPYINGATADKTLIMQSDLVKAGKKTGEDAMRSTAIELNKAIVRQLRIDPSLKEKYMQAVAAGAAPAWDRPEDAP